MKLVCVRHTRQKTHARQKKVYRQRASEYTLYNATNRTTTQNGKQNEQQYIYEQQHNRTENERVREE